MQLKYLPNQFYRIRELVSLSKKAELRLKWIEFYHSHNRNVSLTARHFGISRETVRRWVGRFEPYDLTSLEDRSRYPRRVRKRATPDAVIRHIIELRKRYPSWSKYKLCVLLRRDGIVISASTVGRVLKKHNLILPRKKRRSRTRLKRTMPPKTVYCAYPGSLVQFDAKYIYPTPGVRWFQLTALDTYTRLRKVRLFSNLSSRSATTLLHCALSEFGFEIKSVQTDNGSEFAKYFHAALEELRIPHYFSRPNTPKDLAMLERSHKTDDDEFYSQTDLPLDIDEANELLREWQDTYNWVRPHQGLGYLTPQEKLMQYMAQKGTPKTASHVMNQNKSLTRQGLLVILNEAKNLAGQKTCCYPLSELTPEGRDNPSFII